MSAGALLIQAVVLQVRYRVARQGWHRWAEPKPHCCERRDWLPVTYTNRKGITSYLCRSVTKTGRSRYFFAHEPRGEPVEETPEGYKIGESANGLVFLKKDRPAQILPAEVAAVEAAVKRHPKSPNYRVSVKHDRIEIHERIGPDAEELTRCNRSGGRRCREQRWRRTPPIGSIAGFSEVVQHIALLLFQGGNDCHDPFSKTTTCFALGSETHLAPEHTMADLPLAQVVGRFYAFDVHEGPQRLLAFEDVTAGTPGLVVGTGGSLSKQFAYLLLDQSHFRLEGGTSHRSISYPVPPCEHQVTLGEDSFADALGFTPAFDECLEVAQEVRPT